MRLRLKQRRFIGFRRIRFDVKIDKIQSFSEPRDKNEEGIKIYLRGPHGTGLLILRKEEIDSILIHMEKARPLDILKKSEREIIERKKKKRDTKKQ